MRGGEFLQGLYIPELRHRSFSSSERLVGILGSIVEPPTALLIGSIADYRHRRSVRPKSVRHDGPRPAVALQRALQKLQRSSAIPALRGENLEHFAFVIDGAPQIVRLAIDPDENLVEVPSPPGIRSTMNASSPYLRSEHRTKPVPPVSRRQLRPIVAGLGLLVLQVSMMAVQLSFFFWLID